jgi:hypothetical protein
MLGHYPKNDGINAFLDIISSNVVFKEDVKAMEKLIWEGRGTLDEFEDWSNPDQWIKKKLTGIPAQTADLIWNKSRKVINPRYAHHVVRVIEKKTLVDINEEGKYVINNTGLDFLLNPEGDTVREIDLEEGFAYMLLILAERPGLKAPDIISVWSYFVKEVAPQWKTKKSIADLYRRRISNLRDRGMAEMRKFRWYITEKGKSYLDNFDESRLIPLKPVDTVGLSPEKEPRRPKAREASDHDLTQLRLVELGYLMGFAVYVARSDKSKKIKGVELAEYEIGELPARGLSRELKRRMANIDIIWFDADTFLPVAFIEIENTTGFNKNLTKINDLLSEIPPGYAHSAGVYIIGYHKDREQAEDIMFGPTFAPLEGRCREYKFISVEEVAIEYESFEPRLKREFDKIEKAKEEIQKRKEYIEKLKERKFSLFALS